MTWEPYHYVLVWMCVTTFLGLLVFFAAKASGDATSEGAAEAAEEYGCISAAAFWWAVIILICATVALKLCG